MTGFNLPPGCNVSDIPGNRPEDDEIESIMDIIYDQFPDSLSAIEKESLCLWIVARMGESYDAGYKQGMADEAMARECNEMKEAENEMIRDYYNDLSKE
jgi:hypothetical protein